MKIIKACNDEVLIVEDFLPEDERLVLDSFVREFNWDGLKEHSFTFWGKRLINEHELAQQPGFENSMEPIRQLLKSVNDRIIQVLNENDRVADWNPSPHNILKMWVNSNPMNFADDDSLEMFIHIDNQEHMESPIIWGAVMYINDDYEGGEIYYPDFDYWYKPKPGSIVFHTGNTRHGVKKVTSGVRYNAPSLVTIHGLYNENPLPARTDNPEDPYFYPPGYWGVRMPDDPVQGEIKVPRSNGTTAKFNSNPREAFGDKKK